MEQTLQSTMQAKDRAAHVALARAAGWGLVGGLAGTLAMDLALMAGLSAIGLPALTCFTIVGNTAARFFSLLGLDIAGGVLAGVATHYLVGPAVGALFGALVALVAALRVDTLKKSMLLAVLYVEILSQPILVTSPILLKMTPAEILQWYAGSFVMHFLFGVVLGTVVYYGLHHKNESSAFKG